MAETCIVENVALRQRRLARRSGRRSHGVGRRGGRRLRVEVGGSSSGGRECVRLRVSMCGLVVRVARLEHDELLDATRFEAVRLAHRLLGALDEVEDDAHRPRAVDERMLQRNVRHVTDSSNRDRTVDGKRRTCSRSVALGRSVWFLRRHTST